MSPFAPFHREFWIPAAYLLSVAATVGFALVADAPLGGTSFFVLTLPWSAIAAGTGTLADSVHPSLGAWVAVLTMAAGALCNALVLHHLLRPRRLRAH